MDFITRWLVLAIAMCRFYIEKGTHKGLYKTIQKTLKFFQTFALLELVHCALGIVRTSVLVTGVQVSSRIFMVWLITNSIKQIQNEESVLLFLVVWTVTEITRYSYYTFNLLHHLPYFIKWARRPCTRCGFQTSTTCRSTTTTFSSPSCVFTYHCFPSCIFTCFVKEEKFCTEKSLLKRTIDPQEHNLQDSPLSTSRCFPESTCGEGPCWFKILDNLVRLQSSDLIFCPVFFFFIGSYRDRH
ncbi:very-long-chain (3R)-3-hydroxyacyl-CoA dehydratase 1 isoform X2 [Dendrobates tinctorius]|uniref:very-long-chain (3R)-3-hydroxyacyl-CoA dehydratase 1 isoform X2 n=1 Tax=Dendrobates tinctorius TaxID=92724 RepID=UPI003CCA4FA2